MSNEPEEQLYYEDQSVRSDDRSDDTPEASNVAFHQLQEYELPVEDEGQLTRYGGGASQQPHEEEESKDSLNELISTALHPRRSTRYRDDDDDDDYDGMDESFATGSFSAGMMAIQDSDSVGVLAMQDSPVMLAIQDNPGMLAVQDSPVMLAIQDNPGMLAMQDTAGILAMQDNPVMLAIQDNPGMLAIQDDYNANDSAGVLAIQDSPGMLAIQDDNSESTAIVPVETRLVPATDALALVETRLVPATEALVPVEAPVAPVDTRLAPFVPVETHLAPIVPAETRLAPLCPVDTRLAPFVPVDTRLAPFVPVDTRLTPFVPGETRLAPPLVQPSTTHVLAGQSRALVPTETRLALPEETALGEANPYAPPTARMSNALLSANENSERRNLPPTARMSNALLSANESSERRNLPPTARMSNALLSANERSERRSLPPPALTSTALVPANERSIQRNDPPTSQTSTALVSADERSEKSDKSERRIVPIEQMHETALVSANERSSRRTLPIEQMQEPQLATKSIPEGLENDGGSAQSEGKSEKSEHSIYDPAFAGVVRRDIDDSDVSLTAEEVFRDNDVESQEESRTLDSGSWTKPQEEGQTVDSGDWAKPYADDVTTEEDIDDESTINTHGSSYWNSSQAHVDKRNYSVKPQTIDEGDEEEASESSHSQNSRLQKPTQKADVSIASSYRASRDSFTSGSQQTSGASTRSSRSVMRMVQRPGGIRPSRRDSREVEVSMDGFMHQHKPIGHDDMGSTRSLQPLLESSGDDKQKKLPRYYMYFTACALLGLLASVMFFAAHIGPFVVQQPQGKGDPTSTSAKEVVPDGAASSSSHLAEGPLSGEDYSGAQSTDDSTAIPVWMSSTFVNWRRSYTPSSELPFIWNHEKSGGEVVAETLTKCLSKVVAGDGKRYDKTVNSDHFNTNNFKVLSSDGHLFVNVDLSSSQGIDRAGAMGLTQNRVSDLAYTPFLKEGAQKLFIPPSGQGFPEVSGRLLIVFRDPIDRALNRYEATRILTGNDALTLTDYATNPIYSENNPLTRDLLGLGPKDALENEQIKAAQEVINQHVLVGLFDQIENSILRYEEFFRWYMGGANAAISLCHEQVWESFQMGYRIGSNYATADPAGYNMVAASHTVDKLLYNYAKALFDLQGNALRELDAAGTKK